MAALQAALTLVAVTTAFLMPCAVVASGSDGDALWPQWRGPLATGVAPVGDPPIRWAEDRNVRWKLAVPGRGHATPVIWGEHVFLTTAVEVDGSVTEAGHQAHGAHDNVASWREHDLIVVAVRRATGAIDWQTTVRRVRPHQSTHVSGSWASSSAVVDRDRVYAFYGSGGLVALDHRGKLVWQVDLGDLSIKHAHGEGASPALHGSTLVVNWDHEGDSFVVALDSRSGEERWRRARDEATSWSTPLIVEHGGKAQVIVAATKRVRSYDLASGESIWECAGLGGNVVATPVAGDGIVYVANSYDTQAMLAIRLEGAKGDVTGTDAIVWSRDRHTPYVPSPLLYGGVLYFFKHYQGILFALDAASGATLYGPERLPGIRNVYASPVAVAGRVYIVSLDGSAVVLRAGGELEVMASNRLDDEFAASPAIAGDELYLRGHDHLYCIAADTDSAATRPVATRPVATRPAATRPVASDESR